jgi:hypothetical protein
MAVCWNAFTMATTVRASGGHADGITMIVVATASNAALLARRAFIGRGVPKVIVAVGTTRAIVAGTKEPLNNPTG